MPTLVYAFPCPTHAMLRTHQIHTVSSASNQAGITDGIQGTELIKGNAAMQEMDGHALHSAKSTVDPSDGLVDDGPEVLILLDILPRRHGDLNQDDFPYPLWVVIQELLEAVELLRDTLDVVQPVHADDDLDSLEASFQAFDPLLYCFPFEAFLESGRLNTDGERAYMNIPAFEVCPVGHRGDAQDAGTRREEMSSVVVGVESDEIAVQDA